MVTLGIDFGTSSTVAVLGLDGGRAVPLLFGETPLLPSAVSVGGGGELLVGRDAVQASRARPEAYEPNPKARLDDGELLLGERVVPIAELIGAVLRRVYDEAVRVAGGPVDRVVLTHPASWDARRRQVLLLAAAGAGLPLPVLVAEPVAAAAYYVHALGHAVPPGGCLVVYDFGAGTFDASVVRRTAGGFEVLAAQGIPDAGGLDVDAAIVVDIGATHGAADPAGWQRLTEPATPADRRAAQTFWEDVRAAKETLSRAATTTIFVPILEIDVVLTREQLDHLARPLLERTVEATRIAVRNAGIGPAQIAAVFLVGGSSRMALPVALLHRALGVAPTAIEQPELIVAGGTLHVGGALRTGPELPMAVPPAAARHRTGLVVAGALVALFLVAGVIAGLSYLGDRADGRGSAAPAATAASGAPAAASSSELIEGPACKPRVDSSFPRLLGGFDRRLATQPVITASTAELSGLGRTILIEGTCDKVQPGQIVTANYVGATLRDGKVFDSSWARSQTIDVHVGLQQQGQTIEVIEGWDTGLVGIRVGSRVQLDIPARMAYGDNAPVGAPQGALRFVVDVLDTTY